MTAATTTATQWWQVALDVVLALGTVGAVITALIVAATDRNAADHRAVEDRKAAEARASADRQAIADRERQERDYGRRLTYAMWRLDLLVRLSQAHEHVVRLWVSATPESDPHPQWSEALGAVTALVQAYPGQLGTVRRLYVGGPPEHPASHGRERTFEEEKAMLMACSEEIK